VAKVFAWRFTWCNKPFPSFFAECVMGEYDKRLKVIYFMLFGFAVITINYYDLLNYYYIQNQKLSKFWGTFLPYFLK